MVLVFHREEAWCVFPETSGWELVLEPGTGLLRKDSSENNPAVLRSLKTL